MIEITPQQASDLSHTHMVFWDTQILAKSRKAFQVRFMNQRGAMTTQWLPISKIKVLIVPMTDAPGESRTKGKYFIPKFFTR